VNFALVDN